MNRISKGPQVLTPRRSTIVLKTLIRPSERPLNPKTSHSERLAYQLFEQNRDIAHKVLNAKFIRGIRNGNLSPIDYGGYTVQDAIYCHQGRLSACSIAKSAL